MMPIDPNARNFYLRRLARFVVLWNTYADEMSEEAKSGLAYCLAVTLADCEDHGAAGQAKVITAELRLNPAASWNAPGVYIYKRQWNWTCPRCKRSTWHPEDVRNAYCPCCGNDRLPKYCEHRPTPTQDR